MAYIDIFAPLNRITIKFNADIPVEILCLGALTIRANDANGEFVMNGLEAQYVETDVGNRVMPVLYPERFIAVVLPSYGFAQIGYLIKGMFLYAEELEYSPRLMNMIYDPLTLNSRLRPFTEKGREVAVFTQAFNEGEMLLYWERFYGEQVGYENLYVLNNAGTDGSCERLNPATNVINMPAVKVDHVEFAQSQGHFQRFLLMRYQWVIKVDADELLAFEGGMLNTLATLATLAPGTYVPGLALEPAHDTEREAPFRFDGSVAMQRRHFVDAGMGVVRPCLSSEPTSWSTGNHLCVEPAAPLPGMAVVHLRYVDFDFLLNKNRRWSAMQASEREIYTTKHIEELSKLGEQELHERSLKEMAGHLARAALPLPAWLTAAI